MDELNKDEIKDVTGVPEETATDVSEAVENVTETAEEIASADAETTGDSSESNNEDFWGTSAGEVNVNDEDEVAVVEASKKTTVVLVSIIVVLVAVIAILGGLFIKKLRDDKKAKEISDDTVRITESADVTGSADITAEPADEEVVNPGQKDYNVTLELGQYKGIEAEYNYVAVTEEDIEDRIQAFCEDYSEEIEITDRAVEDGDTVLIDFTGYMNGETFEGGTATDFELEIGSGSFIDGFEEGLIGVNPGETVTLDLAFPDPYPNNTDFSGKPVQFEVTVNAIYTIEIPEFTNELVAENTEYSTAVEYITATRDELEQAAKEEADEAAKTEIVEKIIANSTFGGDIDEEISDTVAYWKSYYDNMYMSYYGVDAATIFGYYYGWSEEDYDKYMTDQYTFQVKYSYVLKKIAEAEGFEVSEDEFEARFQEYFFDYYGFESKEEVYEEITPEEADELIKSSILQDKAEQLILDSAVINK